TDRSGESGRNHFLHRRGAMEGQKVRGDRRSESREHQNQNENFAKDHRSHSPNTISIAPRMAVASGSMWPLLMKSIAWRWLKAVGRILQRYGLLLPSLTR